MNSENRTHPQAEQIETPALGALRRSAQAALEESLAKGLPCWVIEKGRIVDLAARVRKHRSDMSIARQTKP